MESYLCALDPSMGPLIQRVSADVTTERPLATQTDQERALSSQIYFAFAMVCKDQALSLVRLAERPNGLEAYRLLLRRYDPQTKTRGLGRLIKIVSPSWQSDALLDSIICWEREIQEYEALTRDVLSDSVKCAVLTETSPEDVKSYLLLNAGTDLDYQRLSSGRTKAMGAKGRTFAGKSKNKGKNKNKDKGKGQGTKGDKNAWPEAFSGYCRACGKWGHKAANCRSSAANAGGKGKKGGVNAVAGEETEIGAGAAPSSSTSMVGAIVLEDSYPDVEAGWISAVCTTLPLQSVLVDSGAVVHVCGLEHFKQYKLQSLRKDMPTLLSAQGVPLRCYGRRRVELNVDQISISVPFVVCDVMRPILSVPMLVKQGATVVLSPRCSYIEHEARRWN
eukprot:6491364-Amphidinium_carterae.4